MRPLDDITVIALEHAVAGPFCTRQLADMGARVIKIERPGVGDFARSYDERVRGLASHFVWVNRSKESFTLNLKHPEAAGILLKLLNKADVLLQNLTPGAAARLGLSYEALRLAYPRVIVCDISGYGSGGPYGDKKAYDLLIQSESGFISITGTPDEPAKAGCSIADISAAMYAFSNILAALLQRQKTGAGCHIDISLLESMTEWMSYPLYYGFDGAAPPPRTGAAHATIYPYGPFTVADGKIIMLALQNEREWNEFCNEVLEQPALATSPRFSSNSRRVAAREELNKIIEDAFSRLSVEEAVKHLDAAGIAHARMNDVRDAWEHPQLKARGRWTAMETPVGTIPTLMPPGTPEAYTPRIDPVPALGEHTDKILTELGYDQSEILRLRHEHVV
jgi:itaconate CoA-transferase